MSGNQPETSSIHKDVVPQWADRSIVERDVADPPPKELNVSFDHFESPVRERPYDPSRKKIVRADIARWSIILVGLLMVLAAICAFFGRSIEWVPQFVTAVGILSAGSVAFYYGQNSRS